MSELTPSLFGELPPDEALPPAAAGVRNHEPEPALVQAPAADALPPAAAPVEALARARDLLGGVDPGLRSLLPAALPFPVEDDPFCRSAVDWESIWFGTPESTLRVFYNARVCFRRELEKALKGGDADLKPWTRWVFASPRPRENEPIHGIPAEHRAELGWDYDGEPANFSAYREEQE